jgi:hypothetical protein
MMGPVLLPMDCRRDMCSRGGRGLRLIIALVNLNRWVGGRGRDKDLRGQTEFMCLPSLFNTNRTHENISYQSIF